MSICPHRSPNNPVYNSPNLDDRKPGFLFIRTETISLHKKKAKISLFSGNVCTRNLRQAQGAKSEKQTFLFLFFCLAEATSLRAQPAFCDSCSLGKVLDFIFRQFLVCPQRPAAAQLHGARPLCCYFTVSLPKFWVITSSGLPIDFHRVLGGRRKE